MTPQDKLLCPLPVLLNLLSQDLPPLLEPPDPLLPAPLPLTSTLLSMTSPSTNLPLPLMMNLNPLPLLLVLAPTSPPNWCLTLPQALSRLNFVKPFLVVKKSVPLTTLLPLALPGLLKDLPLPLLLLFLPLLVHSLPSPPPP